MARIRTSRCPFGREHLAREEAPVSAGRKLELCRQAPGNSRSLPRPSERPQPFAASHLPRPVLRGSWMRRPFPRPSAKTGPRRGIREDRDSRDDRERDGERREVRRRDGLQGEREGSRTPSARPRRHQAPVSAAPEDVRALDEEEIGNGDDVRGSVAEESEEPLGFGRAGLVEEQLDADARVDDEGLGKPHRRSRERRPSWR